MTSQLSQQSAYRLLVVDDEASIREVLLEILETTSHEVDAVADGKEALEKWSHQPYDLMIVDLRMPHMDGETLIRKIRKTDRDIALIVLTGHGELSQAYTLLKEYRISDFLYKPLEHPAQLLFSVENTLEKRRLRQQSEKYSQQLTETNAELQQLNDRLELRVTERTAELQAANEQLQQEIAERKQVEEELRELAKAVETMQLGVTITSTEGKIIYINPAEAEMHGYRAEELLGKDVGIFASPELRKPMPLEQIKKMKTRVRESVNIRKDGSIFPVRLIADVVKNYEGEPTAIVTICEDITEHKQAEEALRTTEQQYRLLAEYVADGIGILQEGKLVFVNKAFSSLFGYTSERCLQINFRELLRDDYQEHFRKWREQMQQFTPDHPFQALSITKDKREIWTEWRPTMIVWENRSAILVTVRDITENKLREMAIEEEREHLKQANIVLTSSLKDRYKFGKIIGKSPVMQQVYELIVKAAASDDNVIIYGESGTGKELVAQTIHQLSKRKIQAFVPVNCGAIVDTLFEREFFGHRKGGFTGAVTSEPGFFDAAHTGTLFLDEVAELSPAMQAKLLRALEYGEYTPVGSHTRKKADVRIIAATHKNLKELQKQGLVREDFFFRIHVIEITVPPLRARKEDISLLIEYFLERYSPDKKPLRLPANIIETLCNYDWPGNIRELQNQLRQYLSIQRLDISPDRQITPGELPDYSEETAIEALQKDEGLHAAVEALEKRMIAAVLEQTNWHRGKTAERLGIPRKTLQRKMKKYGFQ